jgi:hypothetical protein
MADRKQFLNNGEPPDPELVALLQAARQSEVSEEDMREQRISFAYGNALEIDSITKESVREASLHIRLRY